jgi:hypothetical protein
VEDNGIIDSMFYLQQKKVNRHLEKLQREIQQLEDLNQEHLERFQRCERERLDLQAALATQKEIVQVMTAAQARNSTI